MKTPMEELAEKLCNLSNSTFFSGSKQDCDVIDKIKNIVVNEFIPKENEFIINISNNVERPEFPKDRY